MSFTIITDSCCDLPPELLESWGVKCLEISFRRANETALLYRMRSEDFYDEMRRGTVFQTAAVNVAEFLEAFGRELAHGKDVLFFSLSSGLSSSKNSADIAARELAEEYPERRIAVVDSKSGSTGEGMLVHLAVEKRNAGEGLDTIVPYLEETVANLESWFTVDDLQYLKRGGRIGAATAFAATVLDIKPLICASDEGRLESAGKVRGRRQAIKALADRYVSNVADPSGLFYIAHSDCLADAQQLEKQIQQRVPEAAPIIGEIGPVMGSHCGPGTLAVFFVAAKR